MLKFRICGINFGVSILFPAALIVMFTLDPGSLTVWCTAASLMHEAGHFLAIYAFGHKPSAIRAGIFGVCVVQNPHIPASSVESMIISLSGPAVNAASFAIIYFTVGMTSAAIVHLTLAVFNLLPVESLDGGQALFHLLTIFTKEKTASRTVTVVSVIVLLPLAAAGFYILIKSGYNFTLLAVSIYLCLLLILRQ